MTFFPEFCADKILYFIRQWDPPPIRWIHNDFIYVRYGGIRNTKTWSKSIQEQNLCLLSITMLNLVVDYHIFPPLFTEN